MAVTACEAFERIEQVRLEVGVAEERLRIGWSLAIGTDGYRGNSRWPSWSRRTARQQLPRETYLSSSFEVRTWTRSQWVPPTWRALSVWFGEQAEYVADRQPTSPALPRVGGDVRHEDLSLSSSQQAALDRVDGTSLNAAHRQCGL